MTDIQSEQFEGLPEAIEDAVDARVAKVRTTLPGRIVSYDHDDQRAKVRPAVAFKRREDGEIVDYEPPAIPNCPVSFPASSEFGLVWPLKEGDSVILEFASRSLDTWLTEGGELVQATDTRRHDLSDAIVRPGVRSFAEAIGSSNRDPGAVVLYGTKIHLGSAGPAQFIALAEKVKDEIDEVWKSLDGHTHSVSGMTSSGATFTTTSDPYTDPTRANKPASSTVKSE